MRFRRHVLPLSASDSVFFIFDNSRKRLLSIYSRGMRVLKDSLISFCCTVNPSLDESSTVEWGWDKQSKVIVQGLLAFLTTFPLSLRVRFF